MRTKIEWPDTSRKLSGMDRFCGGPSHEDYSADTYYRWVKPLVDRAIHNLEQEIDHLTFELQAFKEAKPKLRYHPELKVWYVVPKENPGV